MKFVKSYKLNEMCTITYVPHSFVDEGFMIMDNRDESINRPAKFPAIYKEYGTELLYPKDKRAGGTWIGVSKKNTLLALMNGAFKHHERKASYRKSRGIVVKELLASNSIKAAFEEYDCSGIEAFYGVAFTWESGVRIFELVWDGNQKFMNEKDADVPHLWSAAMTYSPEQHRFRETAFHHFLENRDPHKKISDELWKFHHLREIAGKEGLRIDRGILKTTSISQFRYRPQKGSFFRYKDLLTEEETRIPVDWWSQK